MLTRKPIKKTRLKYSGFVVIADVITDERLTKSMRTTMEVRGNRLYCGTHDGHVIGRVKSAYSYYELSDLDGLHFDGSFDRLTLRFLNNDHILFVVGDNGADDDNRMIALARDIRRALLRMKRLANLDPEFDYDPFFDRYVSSAKFEKHNALLVDRHLSTLVLENVVIDTVPAELFKGPITHLSLSKSAFGLCKDKFWDWISTSGVCETIEILELNSMEMNNLPFEIMYMENLRVLSVANNKLTFLPHYLAELKKIEELYINKNSIKCLPRGLLDITFKHINYNENEYVKNTGNKSIYVNRLLRNEKRRAIMKLSHLSFLTLIRDRVKLKRDDVPSKLQHYFDQLGSCVFCRELLFNEYTNDRIDYFFAETHNITRSNVYCLPWLSLECNYPCKRTWINGEPYRFHLKSTDDN